MPTRLFSLSMMALSKHPLSDQDILFTRQRHDAKRAGLHWDYRFVLRDKAYSWSTKKEMPTPGKSIILFEQPVHTAEYALRKRIQIPAGEYGAGLTTLDFVRKAKAYGDEGDPEKLVVHVNGGDRFLLKKLGPAKYGNGSWLFKNLGPEGNAKKDVEIEKKSEMKENKYLTKIALNAQAARTMAKQVGILPSSHSAWKYALRHLRDSRGNPLTGQALHEARVDLGDVTNNAYQKIKAMDRKVGGHREIALQVSPAGNIVKNNPANVGTTRAVHTLPGHNLHTHPEISKSLGDTINKTGIRDLNSFERAGPSGMPKKVEDFKSFGDVVQAEKYNSQIHTAKMKWIKNNLKKFESMHSTPPNLTEKLEGLKDRHFQRLVQKIHKLGLVEREAQQMAPNGDLYNSMLSPKKKMIASPSVNTTSSYVSTKNGPRVVYFDHSPRKTR